MSKIVVIDPGHGGSDPGAVGNGLKEKDLTLKISKYARDYLVNNYEGVTVYMTRTGDTYPTLEQRCQFERSKNADLFVSVHINAGGGNGFESYVHTNASAFTQKTQTIFHEEIMKVCPSSWRDRGKKRYNYYVIKNTKAPAILTENGFIDYKPNADELKKDSFLQKLGQAHEKAIAKALGLKAKAAPAPAPKPEPKPQPTTDGYWIVQAGAFKQRESAEKKAAELKKDGHEAFIWLKK